MKTFIINSANQLRNDYNEIKSILSNIISNHERYKKSYFFNPPTSAPARRSLEKSISGEYSIIIMDDKFEINQSLQCSCKNVYYRLSVYYNDKKKDIRTLRNLLDIIDESKVKKRFNVGVY